MDQGIARQGFPQGAPLGGFAGPGGSGGPRGLLPMIPPQVLGLVLLATLALTVFVFWRIFKRAGYGGLLGLLMLVPGVNVAMMLYLAFAEWPVLKRVRELEVLTTGSATGGDPTSGADSSVRLGTVESAAE